MKNHKEYIARTSGLKTRDYAGYALFQTKAKKKGIILLICANYALRFANAGGFSTAWRLPGYADQASIGSTVLRRFPCGRRTGASRRIRVPSWVVGADS